MIKKSTAYVTTDTGFAAFLTASGIKLRELDILPREAEFVFDLDGKDDIDNLKFQWDSGIAEGNISMFFKAYRSFIRQIRERNNG